MGLLESPRQLNGRANHGLETSSLTAIIEI